MDPLYGASILAAFLAGVVALFAPCCITVLLPSYLAAAFNRKRHLIGMTLVYFAGIAVVLVPIGIGAASLAGVFQDYHRELYITGGVLMLLFGWFAIRGKGMSLLPMPKRSPWQFRPSNPGSVFLLGVFSGAATSCCAPVLAGAMTLAVLSGAFWKAIIVSVAYVFGMTIPLFLAATLYDRFQIERSRLIRGRIFEFHLGPRTFIVHTTNLLSGLLFAVMGAVLIILAFTGNTYWSPTAQAAIGRTLMDWSQTIYGAMQSVSEAVWSLIIIGAFVFFIVSARRSARSDRADRKEVSQP